VLPFINISGDAEQEYFSDGITQDIITDLSKVSALAVVSRNSNLDAKKLAHELNVTHVLKGSIRKAGNRVRVTAQLVDASSNEHVWGERYDRDLSDIFALQDEIAHAIVEPCG
jgi:adenylate cyclase